MSHNCGANRVLLQRGMAFEKLPLSLKVPFDVESLTKVGNKKGMLHFVCVCRCTVTKSITVFMWGKSINL